MSRFSDRLISLRKERGMTQTDIAKLLKKQRSTVSGYETEGKEPDFTAVCTLADFFEVSVDYLLGRDDERRHADVVFRNDNANFKRHYDSLSAELKPVVTEILDDVYVLLKRDMQTNNGERLFLYRELFHSILEGRRAVRQDTAALPDAAAMSALMEAQTTLKGDVSAALDKLMQFDMDAALGVKKIGAESDTKAM